MRVRHLVQLLFLVPFVLIWACAGDPTAPRVAGPVVAYSIVSGNGQTGTVGQDLPQPIRVLATDANSQPVANVVVNFVVTGGGGSVFAGSALTDATGIAAEVWTLGTIAGSAQTLEVRAVDAGGVKHVYGTFAATAVAGAPVSIVANGGDGQTAAAGTAVGVAPSVKLADQYGNPVPGQLVTFAASFGGGSVTGGTATSNPAGIATVGSWVLGPLAGTNTLTATATALPGNPINFSATATTAAAPLLALTTAPSTSAQSGIALATQPIVQLQNAQGAPINQAGVQITVSLNGVGGALGGTVTIPTNASGQASFAGLSINGPVGSYSLSFGGAGLTTITSGSISLSAGVPAVLALQAGDAQSTTAGLAVAIAPAVRVTDLAGNPVAGISVTFAVTSGGGSVTGATVVTGSDGVASVGSWVLGATAGGNSLTATTAVLPASSVVFSATGIAPVLSLLTPPSSSAQNGVALAVQPAVQLRDGQGAAVALAGVPVTVTLNGAGATLSGTTTVNTDASGLATFTNLVITGSVGTGYSLGFSSTGLTTITSGSIALTAGAPAALVLSAGDGQSAVAGTAVTVAPAVVAVDQSGNAVAGVSVTFTVNSGGGSVTGATVVTGSNGVATVGSWTLGSTPGTNVLVATSPSTPASSVTFTATGTAQPANFWTTGFAPMKTPRRYTSYGVISGILYVTGGRTTTGVAYQLEAYNPVTNTWTTKTSPTIRRNGAAFGVINGLLYVAGGTDVNSAKLSSMDSYNPVTNTWTARAPMPEVKDFAASAVVNGILYVAGGGGAGTGTSSTVYAYNPTSNTWTQKASLPAARGDLIGASVGGLFYAVGGVLPGGPDGAMQVYDPATDTWSTRASVPAQRYHLNTAVANGKIYAAGGFTQGNVVSNRLDIYDPATDSWTQGADLPTGRVGMATEFINGVMFASGGSTNGSAAATTGVTERYTP